MNKVSLLREVLGKSICRVEGRPGRDWYFQYLAFWQHSYEWDWPVWHGHAYVVTRR